MHAHDSHEEQQPRQKKEKSQCRRRHEEQQGEQFERARHVFYTHVVYVVHALHTYSRIQVTKSTSSDSKPSQALDTRIRPTQTHGTVSNALGLGTGTASNNEKYRERGTISCQADNLKQRNSRIRNRQIAD
jgi:hypothetical protein